MSTVKEMFGPLIFEEMTLWQICENYATRVFTIENLSTGEFQVFACALDKDGVSALIWQAGNSSVTMGVLFIDRREEIKDGGNFYDTAVDITLTHLNSLNRGEWVLASGPV